jgi:hypothetical protein
VNVFAPSVGAELEKMFSDDLLLCDEVQLDEWQRRPAMWRVKEWLCSWLKPWL